MHAASALSTHAHSAFSVGVRPLHTNSRYQVLMSGAGHTFSLPLIPLKAPAC